MINIINIMGDIIINVYMIDVNEIGMANNVYDHVIILADIIADNEIVNFIIIGNKWDFLFVAITLWM